MASPEVVDPYLIPGTNVLRNRLGLTFVEDLSAAEADLSFARALQLLDEPVPATNNLQELMRIHFHLFQDVYDWAGQLRSIDLRKNVPGAAFFLPVGFIERAADNCFRALAEADHLAGLGREEFVEQLAHHYEKINYVHPFRRGKWTGAAHLLESRGTGRWMAARLAPRPR